MTRNARLALGAINHAGEGVDTTDAVKQLIESYEKATTPAEKVIYLKALGNTADPRALLTVKMALAEGHLDVQVAALGQENREQPVHILGAHERSARIACSSTGSPMTLSQAYDRPPRAC